MMARRDEFRIPLLLFGGMGYVAGEALRLLAHHPDFQLDSVFSTSQAGKPLTQAFPHLVGTYRDSLRFAPTDSAPNALDRLCDDHGDGLVAALFATPHGATAPLVDRLLHTAESFGCERRLRVVDLSADFRFRDAARYEAVYRERHPAPRLLSRFARDVPERSPESSTLSRYVGASQPGCFVTATVLAAQPLLTAGLVEPDIFVSAVTGSSGAGRTPRDTTHHPERANNLFAYSPLAHRHEAEMRTLLAPHSPLGREPEVAFVPHSGPFVRGIHATLRLTLDAEHEGATADDLLPAYHNAYGDPATSFVRARTQMPRLSDVVGTNRCEIGVHVRGRTVVVTSVLDNLVKGAAGGGIQWLNRLCNLRHDAGLQGLPGLGWY